MDASASHRRIRPACEADIPAILEILEAGREIMRRSGNLHQWKDGYPSADIIRRDIASGCGFLVEDDEAPVAYFAFLPSPEPTYAYIEGGEWLQDEMPYHVIHRLASLPDAHGVFRNVLDWCCRQDPNIRIDTLVLPAGPEHPYRYPPGQSHHAALSPAVRLPLLRDHLPDEWRRAPGLPV